MPLSYDLTPFQTLRQKFVKFFVGILVQTMTPKGHFEINWPLTYKKFKELTHNMFRNQLKVYCTSWKGAKIQMPFYQNNNRQTQYTLEALKHSHSCQYNPCFPYNGDLVLPSNSVSKEMSRVMYLKKSWPS